LADVDVLPEEATGEVQQTVSRREHSLAAGTGA
jgi:hypothetical protein